MMERLHWKHLSDPQHAVARRGEKGWRHVHVHDESLQPHVGGSGAQGQHKGRNQGRTMKDIPF